MSRLRNCLRCICAASLLGPAVLSAQLTVSIIRGTATDPSGAAVANAVITIVNTDTGLKRETTTNTAGDYELPDLPRGRYKLTATAAGFRGFTANDVVLESTQVRRINVPFEIGTVAQRSR